LKAESHLLQLVRIK